MVAKFSKDNYHRMPDSRVRGREVEKYWRELRTENKRQN